MWIRFSFYRDVENQIRVHRSLRPKVSEWKKSGVINGAIMTYHFGVPRRSSDNLYICLDIPSVKLPTKRTIDLSQESVKTIPKEIMTKLRKVESETISNPTHDKIAMIDYELNLQQSDLSSYKNAPISEILRFSYEGTNIALEILGDTKTRKETWKNDREIAETIQQRINAKLTTKRTVFRFSFCR